MKARKYRRAALGRKCFKLAMFGGLCLLSSCLQQYYRTAEEDEPRAIVDGGRIKGYVEDGLIIYKGIPYAAAPVGDLRWRQPMPVEPWKGERKCHEFGPDPMQFPQPGDQAVLRTEPSEDCLYLNVWRPGKIPIGEKRPVVIWIHGGGGVTGGSSAPVYDGSAFAKSGVIFVSINYRLGRFGYFAHPALTAASEGPKGNFALMDQIAAMQWVQRNINAFGGDPKHITIMGESAGGRSVLHHLLNIPKRSLFSSAIIMSGGGRDEIVGGMSMAEAEQAGIRFAEAAGIRGTDAEALAALRALPAEQVRGSLNMSFLHTPDSTYCGGPIYDGYIIHTGVEELLLQGRLPSKPLLLGTTGAEIGLYQHPSPDKPYLIFGEDSVRARQLYNSSEQLGPLEEAAAISADHTMQEPTRFLARQAAKAGAAVYLYRFNYVPSARRDELKAAPHASEIPFAFKTLQSTLGDAISPDDTLMAHTFHQAICSFVERGNPLAAPIEGIISWPRYEKEREVMMHFNMDRAIPGPDPWSERLDLVERLHLKP